MQFSVPENEEKSKSETFWWFEDSKNNFAKGTDRYQSWKVPECLRQWDLSSASYLIGIYFEGDWMKFVKNEYKIYNKI